MLETVSLGTRWMLPAVGWLMFCSALVRSKPFLWAALVPVLGCVMTTFVGFIANNVLAGPALPLGKLWYRSEEHTSELQSRENLVCRLLLEKKKTTTTKLPDHETLTSLASRA